MRRKKTKGVLKSGKIYSAQAYLELVLGECYILDCLKPLLPQIERALYLNRRPYGSFKLQETEKALSHKGNFRFSPCLFWRKNMRRKIIALIEVDNDTAFQKNDDGPISYLENEMGWLEQNRIFLEDAFIADEDETDAEQAYLNYLADWIFNHQGSELRESGPAGFSEWKQQNRM